MHARTHTHSYIHTYMMPTIGGELKKNKKMQNDLPSDVVVEISPLTNELYLTSIYGIASTTKQFDVYICVAKELHDEYTMLVDRLKNGKRKFYFIPLNDVESENLANLPQYIDLIKKATKRKHTVVVFCHLGVSRSASICIGFLINEFNLSRIQAEHYVRTKRSIISPNRGFLQQLDEYREEEQHRRKII